ncbi:MAG TPA: sigma-70 family RNA polymerase sigma factor [Xanthobacteraceae bacterium]|nr:sigma-70 family RNA polymerase sigma factor [Xanthobacteraceae bacterium]
MSKLQVVLEQDGADFPHAKARAEQPLSDEALIARIAAADRLAIQLLYARHHVRIYRFVLRLSGNATLAEDMLSEVFLDVWRHADKFQGRCAVSTWLLTIARNKAVSTLRRTREQEWDDRLAATVEDPSDNPEASIQNAQRSEVLRRCLAQLSADHREIVDLVYYHEKSIKEVATIVGIPEATVKTRMFYARKHLAKMLEGVEV